MSPRTLFLRRTGAAAALVALPLGTMAACGDSAADTGSSVQGSLQKAADNLAASGATSVRLRLDDAESKLRQAVTGGADGASPQVADLLLGGTISFTVDPAGGKTMREVQQADPAAPLADRLQRVNVSMAVEADGGQVLAVRLVGGDLYARVDLERVRGIADKVAPGSDTGASIDALSQQAPPELQPLLTDVRAGKWVKLPLAELAPQLEQLQALSGAAPSAAPSLYAKLGTDLLAAVRPFVTVTDAGGEGGTQVLDVTVQAKAALKAAVGVLGSTVPAVPGLQALDPAMFDSLSDATVAGTVTLAQERFTQVSLDLGSLVRLDASTSSPAPDLTGSRLTMDIDDSADEVTVPDDVSSVEAGKLVTGLLSGLTGTVPS